MYNIILKELNIIKRDIILHQILKELNNTKKILKERIYVNSLQEAPKDKKVFEGKRGGLYYESEGKKQLNHNEKRESNIMPTKDEDQAIADWKRGREYYGYIRYKDLGKENQYEFSGNDILQARKKEAAEENYKHLDNFLNRAPIFLGKIYKFIAKIDDYKDNNILKFKTKQSWTSNIAGMSSFAMEDTYLIIHNNKKSRFVDISKYGMGSFESENEVISQKNINLKIIKTDKIKIDEMNINVIYTEDF